MKARRIVAIAAAGAVAAGGAGAAIAAVSKDSPKKAEQELLDNAAKRLDVTPQKLRDALSAAQDDQLDEAVKNGDLTQAQADKIKAHRKQLGTVLAPGGGEPLLLGKHPGGPHSKMFFGFGLMPDLARALDLSETEFVAKLRDGKSVADIAKAQGKSLDSVRSAVKAAAKTRSEEAVEDGRLTRKQADEMLEHLDERLKHPRQGAGEALSWTPPATPRHSGTAAGHEAWSVRAGTWRCAEPRNAGGSDRLPLTPNRSPPTRAAAAALQVC